MWLYFTRVYKISLSVYPEKSTDPLTLSFPFSFYFLGKQKKHRYWGMCSLCSRALSKVLFLLLDSSEEAILGAHSIPAHSSRKAVTTGTFQLNNLVQLIGDFYLITYTYKPPVVYLLVSLFLFLID